MASKSLSSSPSISTVPPPGVSATTTTTTVCWSRVRGFSVVVLRLLMRGGLTSSMIREALNVDGAIVRKYLYRLRRYGLLVLRNYFWYVNEESLNIISKIIENNNGKSKYNIYIERDRRETEERQKRDRRETEVGKISYINVEEKTKLLTEKYELTESERVVVEVLLNWYRRYKGKFIIINGVESWSKYGLNPPQLDTITSLLCKNIIYVYRDRIGVKIGLKSHIYNMLEANINAV